MEVSKKKKSYSYRQLKYDEYMMIGFMTPEDQLRNDHFFTSESVPGVVVGLSWGQCGQSWSIYSLVG